MHYQKYIKNSQNLAKNRVLLENFRKHAKRSKEENAGKGKIWDDN